MCGPPSPGGGSSVMKVTRGPGECFKIITPSLHQRETRSSQHYVSGSQHMCELSGAILEALETFQLWVLCQGF